MLAHYRNFSNIRLFCFFSVSYLVGEKYNAICILFLTARDTRKRKNKYRTGSI